MHKIKAILKRTNEPTSTQTEQTEFKLGRFCFHFPSRTLALDHEKQILSPKEAELLLMLCNNMNQLVKREEIFAAFLPGAAWMYTVTSQVLTQNFGGEDG